MFKENRERVFPSESRTSRHEYQLNLAARVFSQRVWAKSGEPGSLRKERIDKFLLSISGRDSSRKNLPHCSCERMAFLRKLWMSDRVLRAEAWPMAWARKSVPKKKPRKKTSFLIA